MRVKTGRGRPSLADYVPHVRQALVRVGDVVSLSESPLCGLEAVQARVGDNGLFAEGMALQEVLVEALDTTLSQLCGDGKVAVLRTILEGIREGRSVTRVAREDLKRSREHVMRSWWPLAARLVTRNLLETGVNC